MPCQCPETRSPIRVPKWDGAIVQNSESPFQADKFLDTRRMAQHKLQSTPVSLARREEDAFSEVVRPIEACAAGSRPANCASTDGTIGVLPSHRHS